MHKFIDFQDLDKLEPIWKRRCVECYRIGLFFFGIFVVLPGGLLFAWIPAVKRLLSRLADHDAYTLIWLFRQRELEHQKNAKIILDEWKSR